MSSPIQRYHPVAVLLHWGMAVLLISLLSMGWMLSGLPFSPRKLQWYSWHKWAGVCAFFAVCLRLAVRLWWFSPPPLPAHLGKWALRFAHAGHAALYGSMLAIPLSGWLMSSAKGFQTVWFGVLPLPDVVKADETLAVLLENIHAGLTTALAVLVLGHVVVALKHHYRDRDLRLQRMWL